MKILGIETSADDTGIALIDIKGDFESGVTFDVLANAVCSQTGHAEYGGIYPNLAKNEHRRNLPILLEKVLADSGITKSPAYAEASAGRQETNPKIDAVAVTVGPGLEPCLWTGINFAQELSAKNGPPAGGVPIVPVNHMEGHILVALMRDEKSNSCQLSAVSFPAVVLLISGGHTELILMRAFGQYEYLGRTRDDAVGEAFDKVARMLNLPYPGGPHISRLAAEARSGRLEADFKLPRPMIHEPNFDFSFAGLKTAVLRIVEKEKPVSEELKKQIAREFEDAAADVLVAKTLRAVEEHGARTVIVGGGVSANAHIRLRLAEALAKTGAELFLCPIEFSGDNALMIALAGYFRALKKELAKEENLAAKENLRLDGKH